MATERMEESWSRIKTQIQNIWGDFDEKEMKKARGDLREMVSMIHEKTGEDVQQIIQKISTGLLNHPTSVNDNSATPGRS